MSVSIIVTSPASTGITAINRKAVISQVQTNSGICIQPMLGARKLVMVTMIFNAPMIEDKPSKCTPNMKKVVDGGA